MTPWHLWGRELLHVLIRDQSGLPVSNPYNSLAKHLRLLLVLTSFRPVLISHSTEGRRLSWPGLLVHIWRRYSTELSSSVYSCEDWVSDRWLTWINKGWEECPLSSGVLSEHKQPTHALRPFYKAYIGHQWISVLCTNCVCWCLTSSTVLPRHT